VVQTATSLAVFGHVGFTSSFERFDWCLKLGLFERQGHQSLGRIEVVFDTT